MIILYITNNTKREKGHYESAYLMKMELNGCRVKVQVIQIHLELLQK